MGGTGSYGVRSRELASVGKESQATRIVAQSDRDEPSVRRDLDSHHSGMPGTPLPSLSLLMDQVTSEREAMNAHAESLDTKAGVVLGFIGVLVGLVRQQPFNI
jgi:hypothetical protein